MKRILFTAAEPEELACAQDAWKEFADSLDGLLSPDFLLTGIGTVSTCHRLVSQILEKRRQNQEYDLIINIGIAGSYDIEAFPAGSVALIEKEYFGDLGFETQSGFRTLFQYGAMNPDEYPYSDGALYRIAGDAAIEDALKRFRSGTGVTVQTVSGEAGRVAALKRMFSPHIESMEGAAVYYVCRLEKVPCIELRSVSNEVGQSDSSLWNVSAALGSLGSACTEIFRTFV